MTEEMSHAEKLYAMDVAMIKDQDQWPLWPILPMKKIGPSSSFADRDHGIVTANAPSVVVIISLFDLVPGRPLGEQLEGRTKLTYESVEAMVLDGWIGD